MDKKLKITIFGDSPEAKLSGGARINTIIDALNGESIDFVLISSFINSNRFSIEHKKTKEIESYTLHFPTRFPRFLKALLLLCYNTIFSFKMSKASDVYFLGGGTIYQYLPSLAVSKFYNVLTIFDFLDIEVETNRNRFYCSIIQKIDIIFAISRYLEKEAKKYGCKKVVFVPAFVNTDLFKKDIEESKEKNDSFVIGYAGALAETEGLPVLIRALYSLVEKIPNLELNVLGSEQFEGQGKDIFNLVKEYDLQDKIHFFPPVKHEEVPKFLSSCDILCCPKIDCEINRAANPIKVVEYLSMGIPTICSAIGEIPLIIEDKKNGFLCKPGDCLDLAEKIECVVGDFKKSFEVAQNARFVVMDNYSTGAVKKNIFNNIFEFVN